MGEHQTRAVINIEPLLHPVSNIGKKFNVEEWGFISCLNPKTASDLPPQLRKYIEAMAEQCPMRFDPSITLAEGNKHR